MHKDSPPDFWRVLLSDARRDWVSFHMPGHQRGRGFPRSFARYLTRMDITEVPGMDDLNDPRGVLRLAQARLAEAAGAQRSFFLTNGASAGIMAMTTALAGLGDSLIVPRASHRSVYHGLMLGDILPVYICTGCQDGRPFLPTPEATEALLDANPGAAGMVLTCPDYWGRCPDTAGIAEVLHRRGKALLLDQAHGAHFGAHPALPPHGGQTGADSWVQSAHKTLPALTQSAWLHLSDSGRLPAERVERKIRLLQTTSPSYPMMAGLDYARHWLETGARDAYGALLRRIEGAVAQIEAATPIRRADFSRDEGVVHTDPTRLVLDVSGTGCTAKEIEAYLSTQRIRAEWAGGHMLVLICTPWHTRRDFMRLTRALRHCPRPDTAGVSAALPPLPVPRQVMPMARAAEAPAERIRYRDAAGRVAAAFVIPYPPGIPLLCPGETVTDAHIGWIEACGGAYPSGIDAAGCLSVIQ